MSRKRNILKKSWRVICEKRILIKKGKKWKATRIELFKYKKDAIMFATKIVTSKDIVVDLWNDRGKGKWAIYGHRFDPSWYTEAQKNCWRKHLGI